MSSRASWRPPNVTCGAAILDSRWRRRKWRQPGLGVLFSIPIEGEVQNGDPSASGGHFGWPHLRNRKWGHPRWRPEAEGPPFCTSPSMGSKKVPYTTNISRFIVINMADDDLGAVSIRKTVLPGMAIPMLKIRRPNGRLIFNMEIAIRR